MRPESASFRLENPGEFKSTIPAGGKPGPSFPRGPTFTTKIQRKALSSGAAKPDAGGGPARRRVEIGEKPGCGMFPTQNEFVSPPDDFGQRAHIRRNLVLKGQAVTTMQPSPAKTPHAQ
jgi:hypothetical protein